MKPRHYLTLGVLLLAVGVLAAEIAVDYDRSVDFKAYKTFSWKTGQAAPNPATDRRIVASVEKALTEAGLTKVDKDPDLWVVYEVMAAKEARITDYDYGKFKFQGRDVEVKKLLQGTLVVDLIDKVSNKLVWRSTATEYIPADSSPPEGVVEKAVGLMFKKFPPPKEG